MNKTRAERARCDASKLQTSEVRNFQTSQIRKLRGLRVTNSVASELQNLKVGGIA